MTAVLCDYRGAAAWLTFNRPEKMNALDAAVLTSLRAHLDEAYSDDRVAAIVITGSGARAFCAGADLGQADPLKSGMGPVRDLVSEGPKPVIAAVNGMAIAGGLELMLACDLVVAADTARFGDGHANVGLVPGGGSSVRLPRRIGATRAKHMIMTGELLDARTMYGLGLVNELVAPADLVSATDALVEKLARKSPLSLSTIKRMINGGGHLSEPDALDRERMLAAIHLTSADAKEGILAFREKRSPNYQGRQTAVDRGA
jgi:enoyl-CoA hydratase/carnithine racemase